MFPVHSIYYAVLADSNIQAIDEINHTLREDIERKTLAFIMTRCSMRQDDKISPCLL